jgi:hypothetical protein
LTEAHARRLLVAGRAVLLLAAAAAVVAAVRLGRHREPPPGAAVSRYACPMHPEVTAAAAGTCPICQMALEPRAGQVRADNDEDAATLAAGGRAEALLRASIGLVRRHVLPQQVYGPAQVAADGVVEAWLYKDEIASLDDDDRAWFSRPPTGGPPLALRRSGEPPRTWDGACARVCFLLPAGAVARPGDIGWVMLVRRPRAMLVVPSTAILQSPEGPYVLTYTPASRSFARRPVEIGKAFHGVTAVMAGLKEREVIVAMNASFFEAEHRGQGAPTRGGPP